MRPKLYAMLPLLLASACQQSPSTSQAEPTNASAEAVENTATDFSAVNLSDTTEDPAYAAPGEDLARAAGADAIGKPAPVAIMKTIDGETIDLGKIYGKKPVYIKFWATWCVPCRQQMPAFQKLYETLGDKIQFVALDIGLSDDLASIRTFRQKYGIKMPIVMDDGHLAQLLNLRVTPQHVLIGRDARFAYFGHADNKDLSDAVQRVLAQPATSAAPLAQAAVAERSYKVGDVVSGLSTTTMSGSKVALAGAAPGRLRGVLFFSSWCEWYLEKSRPVTAKACARARVAIEKLAADRGLGVDWVGVAGGPWSTAQDLADYRKNNKVTIPLALDVSGSLFRAFGIRDIPTIVLIDGAGRIVRIVSPAEADLDGAVRAAKPSA